MLIMIIVLAILILIIIIVLFFFGLSVYAEGQVNRNRKKSIKGILIMTSPLIFFIVFSFIFFVWNNF